MILDSRGNPTVEVLAETSSGVGVFGVPSGASTGKYEALELRDQTKDFGGLGVEKAISNINKVIAKKIEGMDVLDQKGIDKNLISLDSTDNKSRLGANAILGVSGAVAKAAAASKKVPLYKYVTLLHKSARGGSQPKADQPLAGATTYGGKAWKLPKPMFNIINGGAHGDTNLDIQEFMIVPTGNKISESVKIAAEIFHQLAKELKNLRLSTNLGNEGGYSFRVESNSQALDLIMQAAMAAGYKKGDFGIALDVAASELYQDHSQQYLLNADKAALSAERFVSLLKEWVGKYPIISIEDPLDEDDWDNWAAMNKRFGSKLMQVGDDLFVTQKTRLKKGIEMKVANAIIIKPNQVGTITETLETVALAQKNGYKIVVSHRSGETTDDFIADFAVGVGANYVKFGSVARGERVVKYNRLMRIEEEIK